MVKRALTEVGGTSIILLCGLVIMVCELMVVGMRNVIKSLIAVRERAEWIVGFIRKYLCNNQKVYVYREKYTDFYEKRRKTKR
jgi:hypothetical protein